MDTTNADAPTADTDAGTDLHAGANGYTNSNGDAHATTADADANANADSNVPALRQGSERGEGEYRWDGVSEKDSARINLGSPWRVPCSRFSS